MLYGDNIFRFQPKKDDVFWHEHFAKENLAALCQGLYSNPKVLWTEGAAIIPNHSIFALLLRQIGQQNAASLKKLMFFTKEGFHSKGTQKAGQAIRIATQLIKGHAPGVRWVAICRGLDSWDGLEHATLVSKGLSDIDELPSLKYDTRAQSSTPNESKISVNQADEGNWASPIQNTVGSLANKNFENLRIEENTDYEQLPGFGTDEEVQVFAGLATASNSNAGERSEDEGIPRILRREDQEAMYKAVADMALEIPWLKQLSFAGFEKDDPAYDKMKKLQTLFKKRR